MTQKAELRKHWKKLRKDICPSRRKEAKESLFAYVKTSIEVKKAILSFSSFGSEIDTRKMNDWLLGQKKLLLPRVEQEELVIYHVQNLELDLTLSSHGMLEPDPARCKKADLAAIEAAFIPGLCFDEGRHRLGYGKGHYDRLLKKLKCPLIGIGFQEQKTNTLPSDSWDVSLYTVVYF